MKGKLYVVATPIGNLEDITFRAIDTLKKVDCIAAEDTRVSYRLLKKYEIKKELIPFHVKNENSKVQYIVELLLSGKNVAIIVVVNWSVSLQLSLAIIEFSCH